MLDIIDNCEKFDIVCGQEPREIPGYPGYKCTRDGRVFRPDNSEIKPFHSSGYQQICLKDKNNKKSVKGVHQVVAKTFKMSYFPGCQVHHRDERRDNNVEDNLQVYSPSEHARHHANPMYLINYNKQHGPHNKGKKMSPEFCEKCRQSALNRRMRDNTIKFNGNQFVNADRTPKQVTDEYKKAFSEKCRQSALNRNK